MNKAERIPDVALAAGVGADEKTQAAEFDFFARPRLLNRPRFRRRLSKTLEALQR
jgi:hypothetical protein